MTNKIPTDPTPIHFKAQANNPQQELSESEAKVVLEQGLTVNKETIQKIESVITSVLTDTEENGMKFCYFRNDETINFQVDTNPNIIFRMGKAKDCFWFNNKIIESLFKHMVGAERTRLMCDLDLLVVPRAKLVEVQFEKHTIKLIAQEKLNINYEQRIQEQYYHKHAASLNETIRQLTRFVCKTGFMIKRENAPVINNSFNEKTGHRKIALIDLKNPDYLIGGSEKVKLVMERLFWGYFGRGLMYCVGSEEQTKIVLEEARRHIEFGDQEALALETKKERKIELQDYQGLTEYYKTHNIKTGAEQIVLGELDFSDYPKADAKRLTQLAKDVVNEINEKTKTRSEKKSLKARRHILIKWNSLNDARCSVGTDRGIFYLEIVTKKLNKLGYIYCVTRKNGHGYFIQA